MNKKSTVEDALIQIKNEWQKLSILSRNNVEKPTDFKNIRESITSSCNIDVLVPDMHNKGFYFDGETWVSLIKRDIRKAGAEVHVKLIV